MPKPSRRLGHLLAMFKKHSFRYALLRSAELARTNLMTHLSTGVFKVKCRVLGIPYGADIEVYGSVLLRAISGQITIGSGVQFISSSWRCTASALAHPVRLRTFEPSATIVLGDGCGLNGTSITVRSKAVRVGRNSIFGPDCLIVDSDFHDPSPLEIRKTNPGLERDADVTIGENVWVGARSVILKGVTIGDNAVIAAGSVVVSSVPANALAAGNPARTVRIYDREALGTEAVGALPGD